MNNDLIQKLQYSFAGENEAFSLPLSLKDSLQLISNFFANNTTNKLCLVFPSKEFAAQWITVVSGFETIKNDYTLFNSEIYKAYEKYQPGQKLLLNNKAVVEWISGNESEIKILTKGKTVKKRPWENTQGDIITIKTSRIVSLRPAPKSKKVLSAKDAVYKNLSGLSHVPLDKLLSINTGNNFLFQKNSIVLVSKFIYYEKSHLDVLIDGHATNKYLQPGKINENGEVDLKSALLISNNLSNLALFVANSSSSVSKIIIDGYSMIKERGTDFSDIDIKNKPTILFTDLSELDSFETIGNYGFEFFNFTKENLNLGDSANLSPFHSFEKKLNKYISFNILKEICQDEELDATIQKIHSIENDNSNNDLTSLKISLIQLTNIVSRISHIPSEGEISVLNSKIIAIENLFLRCRIWLGHSHILIEESISLLKSIIARFATQPSEKCSRLKMLINSKQYDYIICANEEESKALEDSYPAYIQKPRVISVADVNDKLLSNKPQKAILTGWVKSNNINRILSSFLFSELTVLFYKFENKYYKSLQKRNKQFSENIKETINSKGIRSENDSITRKGFNDLFSGDEESEIISEDSFDILDFEFKLNNAQYSRYSAKGNLIDSIKAKRILFESDFFIYTTESHKFLIINELIERKGEKANLHRRKVESLHTGDTIALINTDRDILIELVEKNTNTQELAHVKQWTDLWKNLLKEYYTSIGSDFKKLVEDLRRNDCKKHEVTIRSWLQEDSRIGPDDDADLISIALLTNSIILKDNVTTVREAIRKMTGWRMKASDFITEKIKARIHEFADSSNINKKISVDGLGSVIVLKVIEISNVWQSIDARYVNRLLQKEIF